MKNKQKTVNNKQNKKYEWNLSLLYKSANDPKIEDEIVSFENQVNQFVEEYETKEKEFLTNNKVLLESLNDYEKISGSTAIKAILYFHYSVDLNANNVQASAKLSLLQNRFAVISNKVTFFSVELGRVSEKRQKEILADTSLTHFYIFLQRIFDDAKHNLSVPEEKVLNLKSLPAHSMWVSANERILNKKTIKWKNKDMPVSSAMQEIANLSSNKDRKKLSSLVNTVLKSVGEFSEAEINAVYTDKKIEDELRGYKEPYEATINSYRNDSKVIDQLRKVVMDNVNISHDFYKLKAKILKLKKLGYYDRAAKIGINKSKFPFELSISKLKEIFGNIDIKYSGFIDKYIKNGHIDVFPKVGKTSGAYCSSLYGAPVFVLLNHIDNLNSYMTCAHELGHAFHSELSEKQGPLYCDYSMSLAETASTLFEAIAFQGVYDLLSDKEKIIALHDRINDDVSTIFRQISCFNFEYDLHKTIREKGYIAKEEIADIHNKNMQAYLGPMFELEQNDGYMFVSWSHIRRFFYVYSYAYGQLVSKAMLRRYKKDSNFWIKIEQYLSYGGKDSPENILKEIGIDVSLPEFWKEGLMEIADDIKELEKLTSKSVKR